MTIDVELANLEQLRDLLTNADGNTKLANRFRALFHLKAAGENLEERATADTACAFIAAAFADDLELLKHEVAYVLGQTKNLLAAPLLRAVLEDEGQQCMVRHEAAEALGALLDTELLPLLERYRDADPLVEIRETCELAVAKIRHETSAAFKQEQLQQLAYSLIDPAPPMPSSEDDLVDALAAALNDQLRPLFQRYRAMFRLRDMSTDELALALATGFADPLALFRHEIAYVFGQMCNPVTVPALVDVLANPAEAPMVRHEAAEALGAIATDEVLPVLQKFATDEEQVVRESAIVALDMWEYERSDQLEAAPTA